MFAHGTTDNRTTSVTCARFRQDSGDTRSAQFGPFTIKSENWTYISTKELETTFFELNTKYSKVWLSPNGVKGSHTSLFFRMTQERGRMRQQKTYVARPTAQIARRNDCDTLEKKKSPCETLHDCVSPVELANDAVWLVVSSLTCIWEYVAQSSSSVLST